jgi:hypothetical protein
MHKEYLKDADDGPRMLQTLAMWHSVTRKTGSWATRIAGGQLQGESKKRVKRTEKGPRKEHKIHAEARTLQGTGTRQ